MPDILNPDHGYQIMSDTGRGWVASRITELDNEIKKNQKDRQNLLTENTRLEQAQLRLTRLRDELNELIKP